MIRRSARLAALAALPLLAGCAAGGCKPKPVALLSTLTGPDVPIVHSTMNGTRVPTLIDTGGMFSSVSPAVAASLNLPVAANRTMRIRGAGGGDFTSVATVNSFSLGASRGSRILLPVLGLGPHQVADGHRLGALIGEDILGNYDLDIDLPAHQVFLIDTFGCRDIVPWNGARPPLRFSRAANGAPVVPATLDGRKLRAMVDSGAGMSLMPRRVFVASGLAAEHPALAGERQFYGAGGLRLKVRLYRFQNLTVNGVVWHDPLIGVGGTDPGVDLLLGGNFLARHEIYIANNRQELFVHP